MNDEQQSFRSGNESCVDSWSVYMYASRFAIEHENKAYFKMPIQQMGLHQRMTGTDHCHVECMYEWERILNSGRALVRTNGVAEGQVMMTNVYPTLCVKRCESAQPSSPVCELLLRTLIVHAMPIGCFSVHGVC
jgi:hypothetical protein